MDKKAAAEALGVSVRRVEEFDKQRRLGWPKRYVRGKTGKRRDFEPEAVEALKAELESVDTAPAGDALALRPAQTQALALVEQITGGLERQHADADRLAGLLESIRDGLTNGAPSLADINLKLTLSVAEAAQLSGFTKDALREAIGAGKLKAKIVKGRRGWTIKRADLDRYVKGL